MNFNELEIKSKQIEVSIKTIAEKLAVGYDDKQAEFFNSFYQKLKESCETNHKTEVQLSYLSDKLDDNGKKLIEDLYFFITANRKAT